MWQKKGELSDISFYTKNCNRLCQYIHAGNANIQEIKLLGFIDDTMGILIKFNQQALAVNYKKYFISLNYRPGTIEQDNNAILIKTGGSLLLVSFIIGLNQLIHCPEVLDMQSDIFNQLNLDLSKICSIEPPGEPAQSCTLGELAQGHLEVLIQEMQPDTNSFFSNFRENKNIIGEIMDLQIEHAVLRQ